MSTTLAPWSGKTLNSLGGDIEPDTIEFIQMSSTAQTPVGRPKGAGLFEPSHGLPTRQEVRATWLNAGAASLDEAGRIISINDELAAWLGEKPLDVVGLNFAEVLGRRDPACGKKFVELWKAGVAFAQADVEAGSGAARQWFGIETARTSSGGFFRLASQLPPLYELGESAWDAFLGSDVARRNMYVRLLRAEAQLDNWVNRWPGVMFSQRADFSFSFISRTVKDFTGVSPEEWKVQPQRFWQAVHEADIEELQQEFRKFSTTHRRQVATYRIRHAQTGRVTYVFEHREALYSSNGLLLGYEGVWLDVTRQTVAEKRLSSAAWKETLAVLTMGLAHDFNNIMSGILSLSEAFQAQVEREHPFQEGLALIKRNSMQASQMVHRIMNLQQGKVGERNYYNLNELVKDTVEIVRKIIKTHIEVATDFTSDGLALYVDEVEFRQVLINLTLNSRDAMAKGGKLSFKTSLHQGAPDVTNLVGTMPKTPVVCLTVSDTGSGIPARYLSSIFDPFFTTKAMSKGAGLGLYNARLFAEKHRGAISVESRENVGTTFKIWLPQADFTESERDESKTASRRHTLLVVGEDRLAEPCAKFLREHGYYTVVTNVGDRLTELLNSPDYQFDGALAIITSEDSSAAQVFEKLGSQSATMRKIVQVVGCNQDELDHQMLRNADVVLTTDTPEPEMISKLANVLAGGKV